MSQVRTDSGQCPHSDLAMNFHLTTMVDSNVGSLHLWATCKICDKRMNFGRGLSMGASSRGPSRDSEDKLGILIPMIAEGDEPTKEWGFFLSGPHRVA
jgi:hypothetical protein